MTQRGKIHIYASTGFRTYNCSVPFKKRSAFVNHLNCYWIKYVLASISPSGNKIDVIVIGGGNQVISFESGRFFL